MLKLIASRTYPERHIFILLFFCLVDVVALFLNIKLPLGILYGPLLYLGFKSVMGCQSSYAYLHLLPFLVFLFAYVLMQLGGQLSINWASNFQKYYNYSYNVALPISLLVYSLTTIVSSKKKRFEDPLKEKVVEKIRFISVGAIVLSTFLVGRIVLPEINFGIDFNLTVYCFLGTTIFVIGHYLFFTDYQSSEETTLVKADKKQLYVGMNENEFRVKLYECLEKTELFLNAGLTLEMLAEKTNLSKHQLSYSLNTFIGKSFYQLIAEYRIAYAKKKLSEDMFITIETLAYECGFNSKTTLNKYFKESTGFAPSQYRSGIISKQLSLR